MPAMLTTKSADLATDFGREWAVSLFGEDAIASLPVRASGKNKGAPKGFVVWRKASAAGYCRELSTALAVGQLADAWIGEGPLSPRRAAMQGQWLGRSQPLAASASAGVFFAEGRQREADRVARDLADRAAERAEVAQ